MRKYAYEMYLSFKSRFVYRFDLLISILATFLQVFIYISILKALYFANDTIDVILF